MSQVPNAEWRRNNHLPLLELSIKLVAGCWSMPSGMVSSYSCSNHISPTSFKPQSMSPDDQALHIQFMRMALAQAELSLAEGNLPIGAVIAHGGKVIATGRNSVDSGNNDTGHAELAAIQSIAPFLFAHKRECTIYTTLEPCMMCLGAIVNAGISTITIGAIDTFVGATGLLAHSDYYRSKQLKVMAGILQLECQTLLNEYVRTTGLRQHLATNCC